MNRANQPRHWQLDVLVVLMIALMILLLRANPSPFWEGIGEIAWCILALAGMAWWVRANWAALQREERSQRTSGIASQASMSETRTIPLTPIQRRFLAATQATGAYEEHRAAAGRSG